MPINRAINFTTAQTRANTKHNAEDNKKYKDPLNSRTISALTYSSEIGATINEIAPKLTFAFWVPSFMYLGADIYDKYKNDKDEYSPSSKRAVKESIRQALTFFILPSAATIVGQKMTSPIGKFISGKISINARDGIYRHTNNALDQATDADFASKESFRKYIDNSLENYINDLKKTRKSNNIFKKFYRYLTGYFALSDEDVVKIRTFSTKNADRIFEIKEKLEKGIPDKDIPKSIIKKYKADLNTAKTIYGNDKTGKAIKTALQNYQKHLIVRNKILKTLGGLASCLMFTEPIGYLVNKILMPQYITPGINLINDTFKDSNLLKMHLKKVSDAEARKSIFSNARGKCQNVIHSHSLHHHQKPQHPQDPEHKLRQDT